MSEKDNGGFAFPFKGHTCFEYGASDGMTLRDYFAAKAMNGILSMHESALQELPQNIAKAAYVIADAMLEARK